MALCIEGCVQLNTDGTKFVLLPPHSSLLMFFTLYPTTWSNLEINISINDADYSDDISSYDHTLKLLNDKLTPTVHILPQSKISEDLSAVTFPALRLPNSCLIYSGVTSVIRALVMKSNQMTPEIERLLGRCMSCLKACKEKSKWTMVCEMALPNDLSKAIVDGFADNYPKTLKDLVQSFHIRVSISNRNKVMREVKCGKKLHHYLEGPKKTLVDVICSFYILLAAQKSKDLKHEIESTIELSSWLARMQESSSFSDAIDAIKLFPILWSKSVELLEENDTLDFSLIKGIERLTVTAKNTTDLGNVVTAVTNSNLDFIFNDNDSCFNEWSSMPDAFHPKSGDVPEERLLRKCQQLGNMISCVLDIAKPGDVIVDFCSGGGHLGLALAQLLPGCRIVLLECKEESLSRAEDRLKQTSTTNVLLYKGNLLSYKGRFNVGVALHACGAVTDLVMEMCVCIGATAFVISPCCYGSIKPNQHIAYPRSQRFREAVSLDDYSKLCHSADLCECRSSRVLLGKHAMIQVDSDRALYAEDKGYKVRLVKMVPHDCTPKNNILIGCR